MTLLDYGTYRTPAGPEESIIMKRILTWLRSRPGFWRQTVMVLIMLGATVAAFYWGRMGVSSRVDAQQPRPGAPAQPGSQFPSDYSRRPVASIYDNTTITREELGEYLISRLGPERLELMINRRIVDMNCQAKGVVVTEAEVDAQFKAELKDLGNVTPQDFNNQILKRFNKTMFEWREDVIRPKLMLTKYCRPMVQVTEEDLHKAYEAKFGPKVECRMIAFAKDNKRRSDIWVKIKDNEAEFAREAMSQYLPNLAASQGKIPPINKHFGDAKIEAAAFALQPGQISPLIELPDGTFVVLKCDKHLPPNMVKTFADMRVELDKEMREVKLAQKIQEVFAQMRAQANPRIYLTSQVRQEDLERDVAKNLSQPGKSLVPPRPTAPSGN
jgi:PPIC-type PPIASE domain